MTPFGAKLRLLRKSRGILLKDMATALNVSGAYLSALEHGHRGRPSWPFVQRVIAYFNVIWDEAEELEQLARISDPRVVIDTSGQAQITTEFANRLAERIGNLSEDDVKQMLNLLMQLGDGEMTSQNET